MAVHRGGRVLYPGFQIDRATGTALTVIGELLHAAENAGRTEASLMLWLIHPDGALGGLRPVDLLYEPQRILEAFTESLGAGG